MGNLVFRITGTVLALIVGVVFAVRVPAGAASPVQISVGVPATVTAGTDFTANINIGEVTAFDATNYDISYDAAVLRLGEVTGGKIGTTSIPVAMFRPTGTGTYSIVQNVPGLPGVSGSGYLAQVRFHVIGAAGASSKISLVNGVLGDNKAVEIPAAWGEAVVSVTAPETGGGFFGGGAPSEPLPTTPSPVPTTPPAAEPSKLTDDSGRFVADVASKSDDARAEVAIGKGTIGLTRDRQPLAAVAVRVVEPPSSPPPSKAIVAATYDMGPDGSTFDPPVKVTLAYDPALLPPGAEEKDLVVVWWDTSPNEWTKVDGGVVDTVARTVSVSVAHFTVFTVVAPVPPLPAPVFWVSDFTVSPPVVKPGQTVTVSMLVANTGNAAGSYTATLKTEKGTEDRMVEVAAGSTAEVRFSLSRDVAGTYALTVNDMAGSFTVEAPVPPPATAAPIPVTVAPSTEVQAPAASTAVAPDAAGGSQAPVPTPPPATPLPAATTVTSTSAPASAGPVPQTSAPVSTGNWTFWYITGGILAAAGVAAFFTLRRRGHQR